MSLVVWLPLTKDLRNQGLSDVTVTNNGATFNSAGKLGGCYYFDASGYLKETSFNWANFNTSEFSLCCWYKEPSPVASGNSQMICIGTSSGWNNIRIGLLRRTSNGYPMFSVSDGTNNVNYNFTADSFTLDTWNHIVCTYNNGTMKMYLNGTLHKTATTTIIPALNSSQHLGIGAASNGSEKLTGYLNDVRIYDHCLSPMEVKELAKGLVLHYPLADAYIEAGQNLCNTVRPGAAANSTWGGHVTQWTLYDATNDPVPFNDGIKGEIVYGQNGSTGGGASRSVATIAALPSTTYTYSCYVKPSDNFAYTHANFLYKYEYTAVSGGTRITEAGYFNSARKEHVGNGWYRIWGTFTTQSNTHALNISFYTYPSKSMTYWVGGWQIEQKDHMTPFMAPNTSRNNNVVYDTSGFCNNGTASNIIISTDTPKYKYSSTFNGTNSYIKVNDNNWMIKGMSEMTVNLWAKATTWPTNGGRLLSCTESGGFNLEGGNSGYWRFPVYVYTNSGQTSSAYKYDSNEIKIADLIPNEWNMITLVYDNTGTKTYLNGELHHTYTNTSYGINFNTNARLFLGCEANTASPYAPYFNGKESDFRIYATALSASDVKSLYQNCATIDADGTIHGQIRS